MGRTTKAPKSWPCPQSGCPSMFTRNGDAARHYKKEHLGIKAFRCEGCDYATAQKSNRDSHYRSHPHCRQAAELNGYVVPPLPRRTRAPAAITKAEPSPVPEPIPAVVNITNTKRERATPTRETREKVRAAAAPYRRSDRRPIHMAEDVASQSAPLSTPATAPVHRERRITQYDWFAGLGQDATVSQSIHSFQPHQSHQNQFPIMPNGNEATLTDFSVSSPPQQTMGTQLQRPEYASDVYSEGFPIANVLDISSSLSPFPFEMPTNVVPEFMAPSDPYWNPTMGLNFDHFDTFSHWTADGQLTLDNTLPEFNFFSTNDAYISPIAERAQVHPPADPHSTFDALWQNTDTPVIAPSP